MLYFCHDIAPATIDIIAMLERQLFDDVWDTYAIGDTLSQYGVLVCTAYHDGQMVGYCLYSVVFDVAEILRIAIDPTYQGAGYGRKLLIHIIDDCMARHADRLILEVRADNKVARGLYQACGFDIIDRRRGYYRTCAGKVDALVMMRGL